MSFVNGGAGLVEFYVNLCDALCRYTLKYDGNRQGYTNVSSLFWSMNEFARKQELEQSLMEIFDGSESGNDNIDEMNLIDTAIPIAFAVPTFQMPESFLGRQLQFSSDAQTTGNLLRLALEYDASMSVRLSSAYLNLTQNLLSILTKFGRHETNESIGDSINIDANTNNGSAFILTAGSISHGFAPKKRSKQKQNTGIVNKIKDSIPDAFISLVKQVADLIIKRGGKVLMYERLGWTFHAKGLWITVDDELQVSSFRAVQQELIHDSSSLVSTVIGSGNYGARSEDLDIESNLVIVFNDATNQVEGKSSLAIKSCIAAEWNEMCRHSRELTNTSYSSSKIEDKVIGIVVRLLKRFL
jgi:CDP-diacylglycerol--glycerol-3-phosphate 3-phosphatidyltransferase